MLRICIVETSYTDRTHHVEISVYKTHYTTELLFLLLQLLPFVNFHFECLSGPNFETYKLHFETSKTDRKLYVEVQFSRIITLQPYFLIYCNNFRVFPFHIILRLGPFLSFIRHFSPCIIF